MRVYRNIFDQIIAPENLFAAWDSFRRGKRDKPDVQCFERDCEEQIFQLHDDLRTKTYRHGPYSDFFIRDPKQRHIYKATVRDRVLHHAVYAVLQPIFEPTFISTSFACRVGYGTHKGITVLESMLRRVSCNGTQPCFALKCDVQKFFDCVDHEILLSLLRARIDDRDALWLLEEIIKSYCAWPRERERERERERGFFRTCGIPIGNLTSQLFANMYMNVFDQFVKHTLKVKEYVRYTDDFVLVASDRASLVRVLPSIRTFLEQRLRLTLHPQKINFRTFYQGIDFLGTIIFPHHRLLRTRTRRRMFTRLSTQIAEYRAGARMRATLDAALQSYLGVLFHANTYRIQLRLLNEYGLWVGIE